MVNININYNKTIMRKFILLLSAAFVFVTFASSCIDDDDQIIEKDGTEQGIGKDEIKDGDI